MTNLTSVVGIIEVIVGIVAFLVPSIGIDGTQATVLITTGLAALGISQKVQGNVTGTRGIW